MAIQPPAWGDVVRDPDQLLQTLFEWSERIERESIYTTPPGSVIVWPVATPPEGWVECDGQEYQRNKYPALFDVITDTYGAPSGTTFNVPDAATDFPSLTSGIWIIRV